MAREGVERVGRDGEGDKDAAGRAGGDGAADGASRTGHEAPLVSEAWSRDVAEVARELDVDPDVGLDASEVERRRERHGTNRLRERARRPAWRVLLDQFESIVVLLLVAAAVASVVFARWPEAVAIAAVIAVNTTIGFGTELRAVRSMEALRKLGRTRATVRRDGRPQEVAATELVPGDVVLLEAGDVVSADLRAVEASRLQADESTLTGESVPVDKQAEAVDADAPLAERACMLFKGTVVTRGTGAGIVVATGMATELGRIASLTQEAESSSAPLEHRLERLGRQLVVVTIVIAAIAIGAGILRGQPPLLMAETGIALAVAAIPEGLPIVATLAMARGMWRLARHDALLDRLAAVETLGATAVILTDKTGTLTENRMTVRRFVLADGDVDVGGRGLEPEGGFERDGEPVDPGDDEALRRILEVGVLCVNAGLDHDEEEGWRGTGDPMEVALLVAGRKAGLERAALLERLPEEREDAFDPETRAMATYHADGGDDGGGAGGDGASGAFRVAVKGSPDAVIDACTRVRRGGEVEALDDEGRRSWHERADGLAAEGLRVLAMAEKRTDDASDEPYEDLVLLGLVAMQDPPRAEVREALEQCRRAGIRVVMVTGDQPGTAANVATALGMVDEDDPPVVTGRDFDAGREPGEDGDAGGGAELDEDALRSRTIFARMEPEQKLRLIALHQDAGHVVAMTGDGVNDAPALEKADIGIAMGRRGTEAAKEAADMVLRDDDFATIVEAVRGGRTIFANIRRSVTFMLCTNVAEVMAVSVAAVAGWTLPLRPLQILYLNVLTDVLPALALGIGAATGREMDRPPRDPSESILTRRHWGAITAWSAVIATCVLGAMLLAIHRLGLDETAAVTVSFLALGFGKLGFTFVLRDARSPVLRNEITRNPWVWASIVVCTLLLVAAVHAPGLPGILDTAAPGAAGWGLILAAAATPFVLGQLWLLLRGRALARRSGPGAGGEEPGPDGARPRTAETAA